MDSINIGTARTYALIGFIFYVFSTIAGLIGVLGFAFFFIASVSTSTSIPPAPTTTTVAFTPLFLLMPLVFFLFFIPGIILTVLAWGTVRNIDAGRYSQARTYSLILGIIGLFFGLLIGGIFFLLAYSKLGESITQPVIVQPLPQRFCVNCGRAVSPDAKFCSHCGKELPP